MTDLTLSSALDMEKGIRQKGISPVELAEAHLAKIERLNPKLNAFVQLDPERVLRQARDAEAAVPTPWAAARRPHQHQEFDRRCRNEM
jgi:aspartyl-tRNA(Asn)/glutamyl-tRNA(Gln) amidotransferase subunit A